jgi:acetophenone carboxylase
VAFARPVLATGIWFHALLGQLPVKYIVKHSIDDASVGVKEGDSFFYGGVHPEDMGL